MSGVKYGARVHQVAVSIVQRSAFVWFGVTACARAAPPEPPAPLLATDTVVVTDTVTIEVETTPDPNPALEAQIATLQLRLLEGQTLVRELQSQLDATIQEVVRTMAKLQSQANRAEAASGIAEAEIAVETLSGMAGRETEPELEKSRELVAMATAEFNLANYGGALYLATQARGVARLGEQRYASGARAVRPGEVPFAVPLRLEVTTRSNVRKGPGMGFDVLFTLDKGSQLTAQSYTTQWVRVRDEQGRDGWIFHALVGNQQSEGSRF